jgi:hypothetical protein
MQPLVALTLPVFIAATPAGQRFYLTIRSTVISAVLVAVAFLGNASNTYRQLVLQPTPPSVNHATPWVGLAPRVGGATTSLVHAAVISGAHHRFHVHTATVLSHDAVNVSGGPGRMIDVVLAVLLGVFIWRRPQPALRLAWVVALVLASRCFFEPVMTPYYLAPPLLLCLTLAACQTPKRFWAAVLLALEVTVFAYHHLNEWVWWLVVVAGLIGILGLCFPSSAEQPTDGDTAEDLVLGEIDLDDAPSDDRVASTIGQSPGDDRQSIQPALT